MTATTRRRLAAVALMTWLPLSLAWAVIWPENPEETSAVFASAAAHRGAWELAASLFALAFLVAVPGLVSSLGLVDDRRGGRLTAIGALLASAGFIADVAAGLFAVLLSVLAAQPGRPQMTRIWDAFGSRPAPVATVVLILLGHLGLILLGFGLKRAGLVGWWVPAAITAGMLVETAAGTAHRASIATVLLTGAGLVGVARALLSAATSSPAASAGRFAGSAQEATRRSAASASAEASPAR